jgi:NADH-quinone oxidoreductase subunit J
MVAIATGINPVYSVFYLILCFCNVSCLFLLIGVDFLALLFLMIYVGAVAVLFLFVVMMVDLKRTQSTTVFNQFGSLFAVLLVLFLIVLSYVSSEAVTIFSSSDFQTNYFMYSESLDDLNSFYRLGEFLYVHGIY